MLRWAALCSLIGCCFAASQANSAIIDLNGLYADEFYTADPANTGIVGGYSVFRDAYDYQTELWELPVKASGWRYGDSGAGTSINNPDLIYSGTSDDVGGYFAYSDLVSASVNADGQYWNFDITVAGDFEQAGSQSFAERSLVGLKGHYYVYFGQFDSGEHYAFNIDSGTGLSDTFESSQIKLFVDENDPGKTPPYGTAVDTTFDDNVSEGDFTGYNLEVSTSNLEARSLYGDGENTVQIRFDYLTGSPIPLSTLDDLDYLIIGVAVSNPSATSDLFANDHFTESGSTSAEYDTLQISNRGFRKIPRVPEPGSLALMAFAAVGVLLIQRRKSLRLQLN